mgnify:CR=1 FL=1
MPTTTAAKPTHYETTGLAGRCNHKHRTQDGASKCLRADLATRLKDNPLAFDDRYVVAIHADDSVADVNPPATMACDTCHEPVEHRCADVKWRRVTDADGTWVECSVPCKCGGRATWPY